MERQLETLWATLFDGAGPLTNDLLNAALVMLAGILCLVMTRHYLYLLSHERQILSAATPESADATQPAADERQIPAGISVLELEPANERPNEISLSTPAPTGTSHAA